MQTEPQTGLIRVRFWVNREVRGARSSGVEYHGLKDAPDSVLHGLADALADELASRKPEPATPVRQA
jgi:hypothetical protein